MLLVIQLGYQCFYLVLTAAQQSKQYISPGHPKPVQVCEQAASLQLVLYIYEVCKIHIVSHISQGIFINIRNLRHSMYGRTSEMGFYCSVNLISGGIEGRGLLGSPQNI